MAEYAKAQDAALDTALVESDRLHVSQSLGIDPRQPGVPLVGTVEAASDGAMLVPPIGRRRGQLSEDGKSCVDIMMSQERRLRMQSIRPASVINLNPFELHVNSPLYDDLIPPACGDGQPYAHFVLDEKTLKGRMWKWDIADKGNGSFIPTELVPIVLAREFESYFYKTGGVVVYEGEHRPETDKNVVARLKEADERMIATAWDYFREADTQFMLPNKSGVGNIGDNHRKYAALLLRRRLLEEQPAWLQVRRAEKDIAPPCYSCKSEPKKGALMCSNCNAVLDPLNAYMEGVIDADNVAMRRLSRAQLKELGITEEQVVETTEERAAKVRAAAQPKGKKPEPKGRKPEGTSTEHGAQQ